jgi:DNA-binding CsgD family transcriptional regulator
VPKWRSIASQSPQFGQAVSQKSTSVIDKNVSEHHRLSLLTSGQRDCLHLVGQYMSSKEIARALGVSPHTVDQRLKRATALLQVQTRFDAARMFMQEIAADDSSPTGQPIYDSLVYQPSELSEARKLAMLQMSPDNLNQPGDRTVTPDVAYDTLHDFHASYDGGAGNNASGPSSWLVQVGIGRKNELTLFARICVIILITIASVLGFATLITIAEGLSRLT